MREIRHRFAGPLLPPARVRYKNLFSSAPPAATPPVAAPAPLMPDPMSPAALEAKRQALAKAGSAGRSSTTLTSLAARAGGTLAGSAGTGQKLGA